MARNRTCGSAQERPTQDRTCESSALPNYDELEMDSSAPRNGIMDARLQPSSPINPCFVSKVRTDPITPLPITHYAYSDVEGKNAGLAREWITASAGISQ
jgi:hypothetical protein